MSIKQPLFNYKFTITKTLYKRIPEKIFAKNKLFHIW